MKKIFFYILIALIAANLFAPLSMSVDQNRNVKVSSNRAEAAGGGFVINQLKRTDSSLTFKITIIRDKTDNHIAAWGLRDKPGGEAGGGTLIERQVFNPADGAVDYPKLDGWVQSDFTFTTTKPLTPNTTYYLAVGLQNGTSSDGFALSKDIAISTTPQGIVDDATKQIGSADSTDGFMPSCGIGDTWFTDGTIMGCLAQIIYYAVFQPTSFLFGLAGGFFDNTFAYSVNSAAYTNPFVVQGWGIVRDFVNMFFIFVLLYVAFSTILSVHGFKTKEMIINVVLIGLFINFSLFATQVIIDTSNILARVFYNSGAIKIIKKDGTEKKLDAGQPIPLSEAIVNKVEPQKLIIDGTKNVGVIDTVNGNEGATASDKSTNLGVGTFILITLLAIGVNIVGIIVFATVGLLFVARVIGLWIAMVIVPLAFFSYTVPSMKGISMIGWEKWWPETLKLAFLAPIFMFFMYLILKFLNVMSIVKTSGLGGVGFVLTIIVPFAFIMILLNKAKGIAVEFSGSIGSSVTKAGMAIGGLALGGAALGAAAVGRQTFGAVSKFAQNDGARKNVLSFKDTKEDWRKAGQTGNPLYAIRAAGKAIRNAPRFLTAGVGQGVTMIGRQTQMRLNPTTGQNERVVTQKGWFQRQGSKVAEKDHADHVLNEKAQAVTGNKEATYKDLDESQQKTVRERIDRDTIAKEQFNRPYEKLTQPDRAIIDAQKGTVDAAGVFHQDANGTFDHAMQNAQNNALTSRGEHLHSADDMVKSSKAGIAMSEFVNALRKGSYDIRNLSQIKTKSKGFIPILGVGAASLVASAVRTGLKKGLNIDHGTGQKDFFKDLGNTIETALKGIKIDVSSGGGGGHAPAAKKDDHGGGGHH